MPMNSEICNEVLKICQEEAEAQFTLLDFTVKPALEAKGFLGEYFQLQIKCNAAAKTKQCNNKIIEVILFEKKNSILLGIHQKRNYC